MLVNEKGNMNERERCSIFRSRKRIGINYPIISTLKGMSEIGHGKYYFRHFVTQFVIIIPEILFARKC